MVLDTDILVDLARKYPVALAWYSSLDVKPSVAGHAALELLFGARNSDEYRALNRFLSVQAILWPTADDMRLCLSIAPLHLSSGIGVIDSLVAVTAIGHNMALATYNVKHFAVIPGLVTIQPYDRSR